jgi:hypothetical protein
MNFHERLRRKGPVFKTHQKLADLSTTEAANSMAAGEGARLIGKQFTAEKTQQRKAEITDLLFRAVESERRSGIAGVADQFAILAGWRRSPLAYQERQRALQRQAEHRIPRYVLLAELSEPEADNLLPSGGGRAQ